MLIISVLPVYLIGLYVYKKDREKESSKLLTKLFILGMISCFPAAFIEVAIEPLFGMTDYMTYIELFIYVGIGIALVEEALKWLIVYRNSYNHPEFTHVYDAIVYCVFVSLGFACLENLFYVFSATTIWVGILRAVTAIPGHACDAVIMGDYLGLAKMYKVKGDKSQESKNKFLSLLMPVLTHTIYDFCLYTGSLTYIIIFIIFVIFIYIFSVKKIKKVANVIDDFDGDTSTDNVALEDAYIAPIVPTSDTNDISSVNNSMEPLSNNVNFCPNCGTKAVGTFCTNCGKKLR